MTGRRRNLFGRGPGFGRADQFRPAGQPGADASSAPTLQAERTAVPAAALTIDALGRKCPIPIIMLAEQIRDVPLGAVVAVLADDPAAYTDIPSWCAMKAQDFVCCADLPRGWALYIRRRL
ncbi:MAG: sulfurtransferase TusA family protein [Actinomycetota bacterium]|nr:sulfurtransferase TusA family protein [Actinomycetota bacterium]